jgi:hypothetical protein
MFELTKAYNIETLATPTVDGADEVDGDADEDAGPKVLSKKEKEKLKKEREKVHSYSKRSTVRRPAHLHKHYLG